MAIFTKPRPPIAGAATLLLLSFLFLSVVCADDSKFALSIKEAREMASSDDSVFHEEFGDLEGPYRWIASSTAASIGFPNFRVRVGEGPRVQTPRLNDRTVRFKVTYFVNEKGNGYGVIHRIAAVGETLPELEKADPRPASHIALAKAADHALLHDNLPLIEMLLDAGLSINEPLDLEWGRTLLHNAALFGSAKMTRFFLDRGADRNARDTFGNRPIDAPFEDGDQEICELLRIEEPRDETISDVPVGLIEEAFLAKHADTDGVVFLSFNGNDPDEALTKLVATHWPDAELRPSSAKYEVSVGQARAERTNSTFRDRESDEPGLLMELSVEKKDGKWHWSHRFATGSSLSGGGVEGVAEKAYGYWIAKSTSSWDE